LSLYQLKVALMIVMCVEPTRPTGKRANTMTERRAHEPVPEAQAHMSLTEPTA